MKKLMYAYFLVMLSLATTSAQSVWIYGEFIPGNSSDVLSIILKNSSGTESFVQDLLPGDLFIAGFGKSYFSFKSPTIYSPSTLSIYLNQNTIIDQFWILPGDSIQFRSDRNKGWLVFSGPAAAHFKKQFDFNYKIQEANFSNVSLLEIEDKEKFLLDSANRSGYQKANDTFGKQTHIANYDINAYKSRILKSYHLDHNPILKELYQSNSNQDIERLMFLSHMGRSMFYISQSIRLKYNELIKLNKIKEAQELASFFGEFQIYTENLLQSDRWTQLKLLVPEYFDGKTEQIITNQQLLGINPITVIKKVSKNLERDQLIIDYIKKISKKIDDIPQTKALYLPLIADQKSYGELESLFNALELGQQVDLTPFMTLTKDKIDLSSNKGKVQLVDFWFTGCGACLLFYKNILKPLQEEFGHREDFQIVSISVDRSYDLWAKSVNSLKYTNPQFFNLATLDQTHPFLIKYNIKSFPHHMLIGKELELIKTTDFPHEFEQWKILIENLLTQ